MSVPSTKTLDHIIHLTPPGTVEEVSRQFRDLGFNVIPGGTHAGGLTANALVILADGVYLELICFTHPATHYPPGSPDRHERDTQPWAHKSPGWIDFAFLGSSRTSIASIINGRAEKEGTGVHYARETRGGRTRASDGRAIEWVLSVPDVEGLRGVVPFYCGDVTPRALRVPVEPPSNVVHPSGVLGIAHVRLLVKPESLARISAQFTTVLGDTPLANTNAAARSLEYVWVLEVPSMSSTNQKPRLVLSAPTNEEEEEHLAIKGPGIAEVAFWVGQDGVERVSKTPYGKIVWLRS